jgi:hypothetical protein
MLTYAGLLGTNASAAIKDVLAQPLCAMDALFANATIGELFGSPALGQREKAHSFGHSRGASEMPSTATSAMRPHSMQAAPRTFGLTAAGTQFTCLTGTKVQILTLYMYKSTNSDVICYCW